MFTRLLLVMFTLKGSLIMMTGPVRAEQNTAIYLAAISGLDNTERNVREMDNTMLTRKIKRKPKRISKSRRTYVKP